MLVKLSVDWVRFATAAAVLIFPLPLLFGRGVQYRELARAWHRHIGQVFALPWHWIDLVRTMAGTWLLMSSIGLYFDSRVSLAKEPVVLFGGVMLLAVILQTVVCKDPEDGFHTCCVFVFGFTAIFFPPVVAGLMLVSGLTIGIALRSVPAFFFGLAVCIPVIGYFFYPQWRLIPIGMAVALLPGLLPMLFQRDLVLAHRAVKSDPEPALR